MASAEKWQYSPRMSALSSYLVGQGYVGLAGTYVYALGIAGYGHAAGG